MGILDADTTPTETPTAPEMAGKPGEENPQAGMEQNGNPQGQVETERASSPHPASKAENQPPFDYQKAYKELQGHSTRRDQELAELKRAFQEIQSRPQPQQPEPVNQQPDPYQTYQEAAYYLAQGNLTPEQAHHLSAIKDEALYNIAKQSVMQEIQPLVEAVRTMFIPWSKNQEETEARNKAAQFLEETFNNLGGSVPKEFLNELGGMSVEDIAKAMYEAKNPPKTPLYLEGRSNGTIPATDDDTAWFNGIQAAGKKQL